MASLHRPAPFDSAVEIVAQGDTDVPLRAAFRSLSQAEWMDVLKRLSSVWGLEGDVSDVHLDSVEDTSKPFHLVYHYHKDNRDKEFQVRFPEASSVKIVRKATVTCENSRCTLVLQPLEGLQVNAHEVAGANTK